MLNEGTQIHRPGDYLTGDSNRLNLNHVSRSLINRGQTFLDWNLVILQCLPMVFAMLRNSIKGLEKSPSSITWPQGGEGLPWGSLD